MIRLTLRQFRTEAIVGFGLLAVLAIILVITGPHLAQVNDAFQRACKAVGECSTAPNPVLHVDMPLQAFLPFIVTVAPAITGLFFGAPLVARELETGTFRLAWTQSVTKRRWLTVKLGLVGLAAMTINGLLTWMVDWWMSPLNAANKNRFEPVNFGFHGVVPIGYAAFAFALGVTAGVLLRRTVAAMGATLVGFVVARLAVTSWVRPNLATPLHEPLSFLTVRPVIGLQSPANTLSLIPPLVNIPNGWVYS
ncbi:MAG: ABC transporter permease subunit, partial [Acidimicrobiales bacterium]